MKKKYLVFIIGPSCVGKSTIAKALAKAAKWRAFISADQIRTTLPIYDREELEYQRIRNLDWERKLEMFLSSGHFDIFCEVPRSMIEFLGGWINRAQENYQFEVRIVFLDASDEALYERFAVRVADAATTSYQLATADQKQFTADLTESRELIKKFQDSKIVTIQPSYSFSFFTSKAPLEVITKFLEEKIVA